MEFASGKLAWNLLAENWHGICWRKTGMEFASGKLAWNLLAESMLLA